MLKSYLLLILAIILEVAGTMLLPLSQNFTKILPTVGLTVFYIVSFYCLTFSLKMFPISIVGAILAAKNAQKKAKKNITSETINRITP